MGLMSPSNFTVGREANQDMLDRLHTMLTKAKITDEQIIGGVRLTASGMQKVAGRLSISVEEAEMLLNSLITKIRRDEEQLSEMLHEFDNVGPRFAHEEDYLGNITIRDTRTGKKAFLRGTAAQRVIDALKTGADEQGVLARFSGLMENDDAHQRALNQTGFWGAQGAGCIIFARSTGRILLAHRSNDVEQPNTWGSWGGAIDANENPVDAVQREVAEEAGYTGAVEKVVPLYVFKKDKFRYSNFLIVVADEFKPTLNWESQGAEWFEYGEWPAPLHFGLVALFRDPASLQKIEAEFGANEVAESLDESVDEDTSYEAEIQSTVGSFNFPWKHNGEHGLATARFKGRGEDMVIKVVSVRDTEGELVDATSFMKEIEGQAFAFIGEE